MRGGPRETSVADQETSEKTSSGQQHLMKLLSMKHSLSQLLTPDQVDGLVDTPRAGADSDDTRSDGEDVGDLPTDLQPPEGKRVFCNGFTGCGGRFRAQRRRQGQHDTDKRVFCNSQGCGNGRKRTMRSSAGHGGRGGNVDMELWRQAMQRLEELQRGSLRGLSKRLFCNNYGGCHNVGKRLHTAPADSQRPEVGTLLPRLDFLSDQRQHSQAKRFFASGFDGDMDSLIDNLRYLST